MGNTSSTPQSDPITNIVNVESRDLDEKSAIEGGSADIGMSYTSLVMMLIIMVGVSILAFWVGRWLWRRYCGSRRGKSRPQPSVSATYRPQSSQEVVEFTPRSPYVSEMAAMAKWTRDGIVADIMDQLERTGMSTAQPAPPCITPSGQCANQLHAEQLLADNLPPNAIGSRPVGIVRNHHRPRPVQSAAQVVLQQQHQLRQQQLLQRRLQQANVQQQQQHQEVDAPPPQGAAAADPEAAWNRLIAENNGDNADQVVPNAANVP